MCWTPMCLNCVLWVTAPISALLLLFLATFISVVLKQESQGLAFPVLPARMEFLIGLTSCPSTQNQKLWHHIKLSISRALLGEVSPRSASYLWIMYPSSMGKKISLSSLQAVSGSPTVPTLLTSPYQDACYCLEVDYLSCPHAIYTIIVGWRYKGCLCPMGNII